MIEPISRADALVGLGDLAILDRLPDDCSWFRARWGDLDPSGVRHVYSDDWAALSAGTGDVETSARVVRAGRVASPVVARVLELAAEFDPARCDPLLLGANDQDAGPYVIMDGNHRATAFALRRLAGDPLPTSDLPIVIAVSKAHSIFDWDA